MKQSVFPFNFDRQQVYFRVELQLPSMKTHLRKILQETGVSIQDQTVLWGNEDLGNFDEDYTLSLLNKISNHKGLSGQSWFQLPKKKYTAKFGTVLAEQRWRKEGCASFDVAHQEDDKSKIEYDMELDHGQGKEIKNIDQVDQELYTRNEAERIDKGKLSWFQAEFHIDYRDLESFYEDKLWSHLGATEMECVDIETGNTKGHFPNPEIDEVLCIAHTIVNSKDSTKPRSVVFTHKNTDRPDEELKLKPNAELLPYKNELDMFLGWAEYMRSSQRDLIHYNGNKFDIPFLLERANVLGLNSFSFISPMSPSPNKDMVHEEFKLFESRSHGVQMRSRIFFAGIFNFDLFRWVLTEKKYDSNTLNYVAKRILNKTKDEMHYSQIKPLFYGTKEEKTKVLSYCVRDTLLPLEIIGAEKIINNFSGICRVNLVTKSVLLEKGQGVKTQCLLHHNLLKYGYVTSILPKPKSENGRDPLYEGATCVPPKKGFYVQPIAVADFASLYPSIMIAHNLDYSTYVKNKEDLKLLQPDDYWEITCERKDHKTHKLIEVVKHYFVKAHIRIGQCPQLALKCLSARNPIKKILEGLDPNSDQARVLTARSNALKLSANSIYGYCAGYLFHFYPISEAVCSIGRAVLDRSIKKVESYFTVENGFKYNAIVVYGDTDSIMILFNVDTVAESSKLAKEAVDLCNVEFMFPMKLDFEKVYCPYLLDSKKRYAGLHYLPGKTQTKYTFDETTKKYISIVTGGFVPTQDVKGMQLKRRGTLPFTSRTMKEMLNIVLWEQDMEKLLDYSKKELTSLLQGNAKFSELIKSKVYGVEKQQLSVSHAVAARIQKRDPTREFIQSDRVNYVNVVVSSGGTKKAEASKETEQAEDPFYAIDNDLPLDYKRTARNDVKNAWNSILKHASNAQGPNKVRQVDKFVKRLDTELWSLITTVGVHPDNVPEKSLASVASGIKPTNKCMAPKCKIDLNKVVNGNTSSISSSLFTSMYSGCKRKQTFSVEPPKKQKTMTGTSIPPVAVPTIVTTPNPAAKPWKNVLCDSCAQNPTMFAMLFKQTQEKEQQFKQELDDTITKCQKCTREWELCKNLDCESLYDRKKQKKRLIRAQKVTEKFIQA